MLNFQKLPVGIHLQEAILLKSQIQYENIYRMLHHKGTCFLYFPLKILFRQCLRLHPLTAEYLSPEIHSIHEMAVNIQIPPSEK